MDEISDLPQYVKSADVFYHLAWEGGRNEFSTQAENIKYSVNAMETAKRLGVKQFIVTGSQAEYGVCSQTVDESCQPQPNTAYGVCKLATYNILKLYSEQIHLPLTWVRVFSIYGGSDNANTLISYLLRCFKNNEIPKLTNGTQMWDFLYAEDAAAALYLLGQQGKHGVYNLASGESRPLKEFVIEARDLISPNSKLDFDLNSPSDVELRANVDKIKRHLDWSAKTQFSEGILMTYVKDLNKK